jgi:hypothetical protein
MPTAVRAFICGLDKVSRFQLRLCCRLPQQLILWSQRPNDDRRTVFVRFRTAERHRLPGFALPSQLDARCARFVAPIVELARSVPGLAALI